MTLKPIYLDHSAAISIRLGLLEAMHPYFMDTFGNTASVHTFEQKVKEARMIQGE